MTSPLDLEAVKRRDVWCAERVGTGDVYRAVARPDAERNAHHLRSATGSELDAILDRRDLIAEVERLTAWRPMESAPKDGTDVLCLCEGIGVRVLYWHTHFEGWTLAGSDANDYEPIGWLPTPSESP